MLINMKVDRQLKNIYINVQLQAIRQEMSITEIAQKTGLSRYTVSKTLEGKDCVLSNLLKVCKVLELEINII